MISSHNKTPNRSIYDGANPDNLPVIDEYPENPPTFATSLKLLEDAKQLAICHMGFRFDCYLGWCGHHCSYCYARGHNIRYRRWDVKDLKVADLDQVRKYFVNVFERKKKTLNLREKCIQHRYPIRMGTNTDCFQLAEKKYRISHMFISEIMNRYDYPYSICTKSDMVVDPEYLDIYQDNVTFQFTLSTLNQDLLGKIERGAPTAEERLDAMRILSERGYYVGCRISPHIPEYMDDLEILVKRLAEAGCKHVISELLRVTPILNKVMIEECGFDVIAHYKKMGVKLNTGYCRYPLFRKIEYQKHLKDLCDTYGMTFATCADEDPSFHTVNNCCGFDDLPRFQGCPSATYDTAFKICRENGSISFEDLVNTGWCPAPETLRRVWDKGYFENILMNLQFERRKKKYFFVECNPTLKRANLEPKFSSRLMEIHFNIAIDAGETTNPFPQSTDDLFLEHTPIETYFINGRQIHVKREDLYCKDMIAPLAKMRGVNVVMNRLKEKGIDTVGVFDFKVSKAGVGIAAMAQLLGMRCIECYQYYKRYDTEGLPKQQRMCQAWGAELYPIKASRVNINYYVGKRYVESVNGYMFPKGIVLEETIDSVAEEVSHDIERLSVYENIVINAGSGTIVTGLLKGLSQNEIYPRIYAICCTDNTIHCKRLYSFLYEVPDRVREQIYLEVHPAEMQYYTECIVECPFPCHPNYDRKAWHWLVKNIHFLKGKTLFWNIGA